MSYCFLLVSWGTSGNLSPLLTAGRQLRQRGHHVRVMADPAMGDEIKAASFEFVTWRRAPIGSAADPADVSNLADAFRHYCFDPAADYAMDVRDEIERASTDALLSIDILFGSVLGAEAAGVPIAMLSPHVSMRPLLGVPPLASGLPQLKTPEGRAEVAAASNRFAQTMNGFLPILNEACDRLSVARFTHAMELFDRPARLLLAMSRGFDFEADSLPENVRYVGPLLDQPGWSKPWQAPWPADSSRPRVLIACSTGEQGQRDLMQRVIDAMGAVDVNAVATAGPNLDIAELRAPGNVRLLHSAPHDAVMKEVALVVTQGGHGTVNRALIHGLPLLVLPLGRDQADNAARVEARGAGLRLPPDATESEIAAAVNRLLAEAPFRACARSLGDAIKADVGASLLVSEMEAIAVRGLIKGANPQRQPARARSRA
jgi:MGT family glycosyltransferase